MPPHQPQRQLQRERLAEVNLTLTSPDGARQFPPAGAAPIACGSTDCRLSEEDAAALYTGMLSVKLARVCQKFAGLISFDAAEALRRRLTGTLPWAAKQFRLQIVSPR